MRRHRFARAAFLVTLFCTGLGPPLLHTAQAQDTAVASLPGELRDWQAWVLDGQEFLRCPYVSGLDPRQPAGRVCVWIAELDLSATDRGARFQQRVRTYAPTWVTLPGDLERWPQDVRLDGEPVAVTAADGRPVVRLERAGEYTLAGRLLWSRMPDTLAVPVEAGIVRLDVGGTEVHDNVLSGGLVRLGAAPVRTQEASRLDLRVHRKLRDDIPGILTTRLDLQVAGQAREVQIAALLPSQFVPTGLQTPLPARFESDGRLRIQVRPGQWTIELTARAPGALDTIQVPRPQGEGVSGGEEIWSFEAVDRLRVSSVEGVTPVDPAQSGVPPEWQTLPAFSVADGSEIRVAERSRGFGEQDLNRLQVERDLWRDFAGGGYAFRDRMSGEMRQAWRLDMTAPYDLQGARAGEQPLLVTRVGKDAGAGVEWRDPGVALEAIGRVTTVAGAIPATGWSARLTGFGANLHLPPGHRLLAAVGADDAPSAWLNRWRLLDIFVVLLVAAAAFRVAGTGAAALAVAALVLAHHEQPAMTWLFLHVLIATAVARAVPEGRFRRWANGWRNVAFAVMLLALVPFALYQARLAFFPQLDAWSGGQSQGLIQAQVQDAAEAPVATELTSERAMLAAPSPPSPTTAVTSKRPRRESSYAPSAVLQSGPGVPDWSYGLHRLQWEGPVEPRQSLRLVVLGPIAVAAWRLLACVLLATLFVVLTRRSYDRPRWPWLDRWLPIAPALTATALLGVLASIAPTSADAATPAPEVLEQLRERLTRPPACAPTCVAVARAELHATDARLEVRLEAHAQVRTALALPAAAQWELEVATVDGRVAAALTRDQYGRPRIGLEPGVHEVTLVGRLRAADSVRLVFPQVPARIQVDAAPWQAAGLEDGRLLADSVTLTRRATTASATTRLEKPRSGDDFPPFARVHRRVSLGFDAWTAETTIVRLAPAQGAFTLDVPLLPGESVLTPGLPVRDGHVVVSMPAEVPSVRWQSSLQRADAIELVAPTDRPWVESWSVDPSPSWHVAFVGTPEMLSSPDGSEPALHRFDPRPGERLAVTIASPEAIPGATVAFESVGQRVQVGQRSRDVELDLHYRSTQGGRHELHLPEGARLQSVTADNQPLPLHAEQGRLVLPLQPGEHQISIRWQSDLDVGLVTRPQAVALGAPASNVTTAVSMPDTRWVLFTTGGGVGPAVLYWAELIVFVVLALLLGRIASTPLTTRERLLVGLGLSTFSWSVLLLFAVWAFAMRWRRTWTGGTAPWVFNAVQVGLALLTVAALGSLVAAIPSGLLGMPDMRIDGVGSVTRHLQWFHDRVTDELPTPAVISVSIWFYKAAMLAWALWLSFALVRWVRDAWAAFTTGRLWWSVTPAPAPDDVDATGHA